MLQYRKRCWEEEGMNKKRFIGIVVACVIVVGVVAAVAIRTPTKDDPEVAFADPKLEGVVREAIDIPEGPIYASNLETLTTLVAYGMNITELAGLEHCSSLMALSLFENQISDISPLAGLAEMISLHLWENQISDISPLANLTKLTQLTIEGNQISNVSPLEGLTKLTYLYLGRNEISDIAALTGLNSLTRLSLTHNRISDISPLVQNAGLGAGDEVWLEYNPLSSDSINTYIPELQARGVAVYY
jgi:Leucine-rich repeat (LRR) protein